LVKYILHTGPFATFEELLQTFLATKPQPTQQLCLTVACCSMEMVLVLRVKAQLLFVDDHKSRVHRETLTWGPLVK